VRAVYDVHAERPLAPPPEVAPASGALVFDGIFPHRPELRRHWDYSVFLQVDFHISIPRGAGRGYGDPDPWSRVNHRYVEGQRLYLRTCRPQEHASIVIDNTVLAEPAIISGRSL
jgi:uridine kinase